MTTSCPSPSGASSRRFGWRPLRCSSLRVATLGILLALSASACSTNSASSASTTSATASHTPPTTVSGTADVAFAGSLLLVNNKQIGPAFTKATGAAYTGRGGGSFGLAQEIKSGAISPNVFMSVGSAPIKLLEPKDTTWWVQFAASPIVVAYSPTSPYAAQLKAIAQGKRPIQDLFTLMAQPGFHLGRTNPATDPQGQAFAEMVQLAQSALHLPSGTATKILGPLTNSSQVFAETALEAHLQAGQLDAASAFLSQAIQLHLPYVTLPSTINFGVPADAAQYATASLTLPNGTTVHGTPLTIDATVLGSQNRAAADAFVSYLVSKAGLATYRAAGYQILPVTTHGPASAIPGSVRAAIGSS